MILGDQAFEIPSLVVSVRNLSRGAEKKVVKRTHGVAGLIS